MEQTTYEEFCVEQRKRADAHLADFLADNPGYAVDEDAPRWLKGTHLVAFGAHHGHPAVFKYYDGDPRKGHEERALRLYQPTGLVARILAKTDVMLVTERLPGLTLLEHEKSLDASERDKLYFSLGKATAKIVGTAPGGDEATCQDRSFRALESRDFYSTPFNALFIELYRHADTVTIFDTTVDRAERVLQDRPVPHRKVLTEALNRLQENREVILSFPGFLKMDDFHTNNIMAQDSKVTGFIDLEMTSIGNEPLLIAGALASLWQRPEAWKAFARGYEHARGKEKADPVFRLARIAAPFSAFVHFTWYWSTDDQPWWTKVEDFRSMAVQGIMTAVTATEGMEP